VKDFLEQALLKMDWSI